MATAKSLPPRLRLTGPLLGALMLTLLSCTVQEQAPPPTMPVPEQFSANGTLPLPDKWWNSIDDAHLAMLIEEALSGNLTLKSTWERLEQARATAVKSGSERFPSMDATAGVTRTVSKSSLAGTSRTDQYSIGASASYELDLWGRVSATASAAELDVLASRENLEAAAISLSAEIAVVWFRLVEQRRQIELLDQQFTTNGKLLELVTLQFRIGLATASDVLQQRQTLEASKGDKAIAQAGGRVLEHQLAVLRGKAPGSAMLPASSRLPDLPPAPATGLPAELVRRRPDIRRAFYAVRAADRRVAAAIADRFPRISLTASTATTGSEHSGLFQNWLSTLAGNLVMPLLDGGRRKAEVERSRAVRAEALHNYGQAVLNSLREVEDALVREARQQQFLTSLNKQLALAKASSGQVRERYIRGDQDFLRLLTTQLGYQTLERNQLRARRELIEFRINLYRAIAGGWEPTPSPQAARAGGGG